MTKFRTPSIVVTALLALNFLSVTIHAQSASPSSSPSSSPATPAPTPIALDQVPSETESAFSDLHQVDNTLSKARLALDSNDVALTNLKAELKARMAEDARILAGNPSLDLLYRNAGFRTRSQPCSIIRSC